jgi:heptosyltransferase III
MRKILVLRGGALGDFIVTLPALTMLRERWPTASIELVGNATAAQLALNRGLINAVHSQHERRWSSLYGRSSLEPEFAAWLGTFDLVLSFWPDPERELTARFPLREDQVFRFGAALPTGAVPAAAHYCEPLRTLGLRPSALFYPLAPLPAASSTPDGGVNLREPTILVHPGSGSPTKNWPVENWLHLFEKLPAPVSLILGEVELPRWPAWSATSAARVTKLQVRPADSVAPQASDLINAPLEELVSRLSGCRLFLGHDSGISHVAAACGARCVLLFGPTDPAVWAPPVPNVRVLRRGNSMAELSVPDVLRAAVEAFADRN